MNKTTNYQLNQWERADRVLMEDFNEDNAKIDGALAGLEEARRSDLLRVYQFPAGGRMLDLDVSKFDLSKYVSLEVRLSKFSSGQHFHIYFGFNGVREHYGHDQYSALYSDAGTITPGAYNGTYYSIGVISIHLDGFFLAGEYVSSDCTSNPNVARFQRHQWGAWPDFVSADTLTTINLFTNNDTTFVTNGGTVYLIGNRF